MFQMLLPKYPIGLCFHFTSIYRVPDVLSEEHTLTLSWTNSLVQAEGAATHLKQQTKYSTTSTGRLGVMCGGKLVLNDHGERRRPGQVLPAGKRKMRGSRLADEDAHDWEAAFQEFMDDDDDDIEPFPIGLLAHR
jgi:hypothetical protein